MNVKTNILFASILLIAGLVCVSAAQPDSRFDGVWVGTETVMRVDYSILGGAHSDPYPETRPSKIAIAQGGSLLGVLEGFGPGRYTDIHRSGNTLVFQAGARKSELSLSADGSTLTERGVVPNTVTLNAGARQGATSGHPSTIQGPGATAVTGSFHREGRK